jgi:hypothetical protein
MIWIWVNDEMIGIVILDWTDVETHGRASLHQRPCVSTSAAVRLYIGNGIINRH